MGRWLPAAAPACRVVLPVAARRPMRDATGTDDGRGTPFGVAEKALYRGNYYYEEDGGNVPGPPKGDPPALPAGADTPRMAGDRALVRTGRGGGAEG
ncbi:hypothetical protein [Micromonospora chersina]|uniref:hypothetical protein n=1 Tax=Micromonospora chersina TaxID=47854 RepID=UPI00372449F0